MPILNHEKDIYPDDLLSNQEILDCQERVWWVLYTISRREKELSRRLSARQIPFYAPVIAKRYRSPQGRLRTSYIPLFPNYVFLFGTEDDRIEALATQCISRCQSVIDRELFVRDLKQIHSLISTGVPLTPESKLEKGDRVRVKSGPFQGYQGVVMRREGKTRLLLALEFLQQGVSIELDQALLEPL
jgi:hypothetical protein